jgi:L-cysteine S-thiosulfotransferase
LINTDQWEKKMYLNKVLSASVLIIAANFVLAGEDDNLLIDGESILVRAAVQAHTPELDILRSGWTFRKDSTQEIQMDDFDNPAFVFVDQGIDFYNAIDGTVGKSCASCHSDVEKFAGLRASMPRVQNGNITTMEDLINGCRTERMGADAWKWSSSKMTAVTALIGLQSRGMPISVKMDGAAAAHWSKGKELYYTRVGQLDMSCANCHEENYGNMIRADHLSQGQINGFPTYRLKNSKLNSIHARFKGCMKNIRATPYKEGSEEFKALELYLASRANGLSVETPSVRN